MQALRDALPSTELASWSSHISLITTAIPNFARKALLRCLPTNSHSAVLRFLFDYIATHLPSSHQLFSDLPDKKNPAEIYTNILHCRCRAVIQNVFLSFRFTTLRARFRLRFIPTMFNLRAKLEMADVIIAIWLDQHASYVDGSASLSAFIRVDWIWRLGYPASGVVYQLECSLQQILLQLLWWLV